MGGFSAFGGSFKWWTIIPLKRGSADSPSNMLGDEDLGIF
jgi:hypothetical protein